MAIKNDYSAGTVSLTNGTTGVVGAGGANFTAADLQPGDTFLVENLVAVVAAVVDATHITLAEDWTGSTLAAASYRIRYQPDGSRYSAAVRDLVGMLGNGNLQALAGLTGAINKIPYFIGAGAMALADFKDWAVSFFGLTPAADKLAYFNGATSAALTDLTAAGRASLNISGTAAADKLPYLTSATAAALTGLTAAGRALLDDADANAQLTTLGFSPFVQSAIDDTNATTFRGTIGLGNVDNTSDASKPVSTAQAAADALKLSLTGGTMTGVVGLASTNTNGYQLQALTSLVVANGAGLTWNDGSGVIMVNCPQNGMTGMFLVGGGHVFLGPSTGGYTVTVGNVGTINCFYEPGLTRYQVPNMLGGPVNISICFIRLRPAV